MPGNPKSPNPGQQEDYVKEVRGGRQRDKSGNSLPDGKSQDSHIPKSDYKFDK